eukprot:gene30633-39464_t
MMRGARDIQFYDESITGGSRQCLETLRRSVAQYCRSDSNVKAMYIGIASGPDPHSAMRRRYDDYKASEGLNEMIAIYSSSSQDNTRSVEDDLVDFFQSHGRSINRTGGGQWLPATGKSFTSSVKPLESEIFFRAVEPNGMRALSFRCVQAAISVTVARGAGRGTSSWWAWCTRTLIHDSKHYCCADVD